MRWACWLLALAGFASRLAGQSVIQFEDPPRPAAAAAWVELTDQYRASGVVFRGATAVNYRVQEQPGFARSGVWAVEACFSREFCSDPIEMRFTEPQSRVQAWVGCSSPLRSAQVVVLEAFESENGSRPVAVDRIEWPATAQVRPIRGADRPLRVSVPNASIRMARIRFADPRQPTDGLALDDLEFEVLAPDPAVVTVMAEASDDGNVAFSIQVKNEGGSKAAACQVSIRLDNDQSSSAAVPALGPGEQQEVHAELAGPLKPGQYTYVVELELGRAPDRNPGNNGRKGQFTVPQPPARPDVAVLSVLPQVTSGGPVTLVATIQNIGRAPASEFALAARIADREPARAIVPDLGPGEQRSIPLQVAEDLPTGTYEYVVTADPGRIGDIDRSNNAVRGSFQVEAKPVNTEKWIIALALAAGVMTAGAVVIRVRRVRRRKLQQSAPQLHPVPGPIDARLELDPDVPRMSVSIRCTLDRGSARMSTT